MSKQAFPCDYCGSKVPDCGPVGQSTCPDCGLIYEYEEGARPTPESLRDLVRGAIRDAQIAVREACLAAVIGGLSDFGTKDPQEALRQAAAAIRALDR